MEFCLIVYLFYLLASNVAFASQMCAVMGSLGDDNGGNKPIKGNSLVDDDDSDSETQFFDSQTSTPSFSGNAYIYIYMYYNKVFLFCLNSCFLG